MVSRRKMQTEAVLKDGRKVTAAVPSSPDLVDLSGEEISDALGYLGVTILMAKPDMMEDLYACSAAYAGFGMGLCEHYTDPYLCEQEDNQTCPSTLLLHLDFLPESLCATIRWIKSAKGSTFLESINDHDLGLVRSHVLKDVYWDAVRNGFRRPVHSFGLRVTQVLLTGSPANEQHFKAVVRKALNGQTTVGALRALEQRDPDREPSMLLYATARGAAEFAKRSLEGPVRCMETKRYKEVRKGIAGAKSEF